ncbi:MAG: DUF2865 domain-containing protein [Hyphomicrobium sp.]
MLFVASDRKGALPAFVAALSLAICASVVALEALFAMSVGSDPAEDGDRTISRVERWSQLNEKQRAARQSRPLAPVWVADPTLPKPSIPEAVVREFEGAPSSQQSGGEPRLPPIAAKSPLVPAHIEVGSTYRTVCVRLCDGGYFPLSYATTPEWFDADEKLCQSGCGTPARLFVYKNPGQTPADMIDRQGRPYTGLATAFRFQNGYDPACSCRAQPWQEEARSLHQRFAARASEVAALTAVGSDAAEPIRMAALVAPAEATVQAENELAAALVQLVALDRDVGSIVASERLDATDVIAEELHGPDVAVTSAPFIGHKSDRRHAARPSRLGKAGKRSARGSASQRGMSKWQLAFGLELAPASWESPPNGDRQTPADAIRRHLTGPN